MERSCHKHTRNTHVKYESPKSKGAEVMTNVKVFMLKFCDKGQGQGQGGHKF